MTIRKFLTVLAVASAAFLHAFAPGLASQGSTCMPTTGIVSGLTFSQSVNTALSALLSMNTGASAPANACGGAPVQGQIWFDTSGSSPVLKLYDGTSWVTLGTADVVKHSWIQPNITAIRVDDPPYNASPTNTCAQNTSAFNAAFAAALSSGKPLVFGPYTYPLNALSFDFTTARTVGLNINGQGRQRTVLDFSTCVITGSAMTFSASSDWYYVIFKDFSIHANHDGVAMQVGKASYVDPGNVLTFENVFVYNTYPSNTAVACQLNYVVNSNFIGAQCNGYADQSHYAQTTSTSSVAIGTGTKTFTVAAGLPYIAGQIFTAYRSSDPTNQVMRGNITSYSGTTLVVSIGVSLGSGTFTDWTVHGDGNMYGSALQLNQVQFSTFTNGSFGNASICINVPAAGTGTVISNVWIGSDVENCNYAFYSGRTSAGLNTFIGGQISLWAQYAIQVPLAFGTNSWKFINANFSSPATILDPGNLVGVDIQDGNQVTTPALLGSGVTGQNKTGKAVLMTWYGGSITSVIIGGITYSQSSGSAVVRPAESYIMNYVSTPTIIWKSL